MLTPLRLIEAVLWSTSLLCASALIVTQVEAAGARSQAGKMIGGSARGLPLTSSSAAAPAPPEDSPTHSSAMARLEIPALQLTAPIVDDDDHDSLLRGAGHIRGTAMPGGLGNFVIAAHRDTYFRSLSGIKPGMSMRVITPTETFTYVVDSYKIVAPEDVYVLDTGDVPQMTLITCYPFHYIGAAPKRFTVTAHLASY